jgi:hypothetical protein
MVKNYPHKVFLNRELLSFQNGDGDWVGQREGESSWQCRAEPAGEGKQLLQLADGTTTQFSFVLYMPVLRGFFQVGTEVWVEDPEQGEILRGRAKQVWTGRFNTKVWV